MSRGVVRAARRSVVHVLAVAAALPVRARQPDRDVPRGARRGSGDPVEAWAEIVDDPQRSRRYKRERGKGGFVRASWEEVTELIAAAHVHTIKRYGPDRVAGFSPIPAMSMASYAAGTRFCR